MSDIAAWLEMIAANCDADDMPEHADGMRKAAAEIKHLRPYVDAFRREEERADRLEKKVDDLEALVEEARGCLQEIMPLHRMVLEKYEGHPDEEFVNWRMDLGVVRRAIKIIQSIPSTVLPHESSGGNAG